MNISHDKLTPYKSKGRIEESKFINVDMFNFEVSDDESIYSFGASVCVIVALRQNKKVVLCHLALAGYKSLLSRVIEQLDSNVTVEAYIASGSRNNMKIYEFILNCLKKINVSILYDYFGQTDQIIIDPKTGNFSFYFEFYKHIDIKYMSKEEFYARAKEVHKNDILYDMKYVIFNQILESEKISPNTHTGGFPQKKSLDLPMHFKLNGPKDILDGVKEVKGNKQNKINRKNEIKRMNNKIKRNMRNRKY